MTIFFTSTCPASKTRCHEFRAARRARAAAAARIARDADFLTGAGETNLVSAFSIPTSGDSETVLTCGSSSTKFGSGDFLPAPIGDLFDLEGDGNFSSLGFRGDHFFVGVCFRGLCLFFSKTSKTPTA